MTAETAPSLLRHARVSCEIAGADGLVGGTFEALDTRLKVGDRVFERAHAAIDFHVRELDHRLCLAAVRSIFSSVRVSFSLRVKTDSATS